MVPTSEGWVTARMTHLSKGTGNDIYIYVKLEIPVEKDRLKQAEIW